MVTPRVISPQNISSNGLKNVCPKHSMHDASTVVGMMFLLKMDVQFSYHHQRIRGYRVEAALRGVVLAVAWSPSLLIGLMLASSNMYLHVCTKFLSFAVFYTFSADEKQN